MKKGDESPPAPSDQAPPEQPAPDTPWLTERLTEAEIEALRRNKEEALAYGQKMFFPNARIHRVKEGPPEEPKE